MTNHNPRSAPKNDPAKPDDTPDNIDPAKEPHKGQQPPNADNKKKHGEPYERGASGGRRSSDQAGKR